MNIGDRVELTGNTAIGETISDLYKGMRGTYYGDGSGTFYIALEGLPKGSGHDCGGNLPLGKFGFYFSKSEFRPLATEPKPAEITPVLFSVNGMTVSTTKNAPEGDVFTFYVGSRSDKAKEYTIKVRQPEFCTRTNANFLCTCPDFIHRKWGTNEVCDHIEAIKSLIKLAGTVLLLSNRLRRL
jgi:predicted nucleic acid-binding Zn finger protein